MAIKPRLPRSVSRHLSERDRASSGTGAAGLHGGALAQFFEKMGEAVRALESAGDGGAVSGGGEVPLGEGGRSGRAVFGYTVRMGLDGMRAEPFGDVNSAPASRTTPRRAEPAARAPIVDVFDEGGELRIIAELPGAAGDDVDCTVDGQTLRLQTHGAHRYCKDITLPAPVDAASLRQSCTNGILELRLRRSIAP